MDNTNNSSKKTIIGDTPIYKMYYGDKPIYNILGSEYVPKIDVAATGIKLGNSTFTEIPDVFDFSNITDMSYMFANCDKLTTIPTLDTSNVTNMSGLFQRCKSLLTIPLLDTANVTHMSSMFDDCTKLQSIPLLVCGNVKHAIYFFGFSGINTLTHLGGFKDLKVSMNSCFLDKAPNLTVESLMNVINNVYDLTANGLSGQSLKFGQTNLDKLTPEQVAVATAKGWILTA